MRLAMERPRFSIILPCFNEVGNIKILIRRIIEGFRRDRIELIFVDDGSTDGTVELLEDFCRAYSFVSVIKRPTLLGLGSALKAGFDVAEGDYFISFDSDLPIPIEDARKIADMLSTGRYDLVLGSRYLKGSLYEAPNFSIFKKKMVSRCANFFFKVANLINITDFTFNCRGMTREAWQEIKPQSNNNFFLCEMVWRASRHKLRIAEIPVRFYDRKFGTSKLQLGSEMAKYLGQFLKLRWKYLFKKLP